MNKIKITAELEGKLSEEEYMELNDVLMQFGFFNIDIKED